MSEGNPGYKVQDGCWNCSYCVMETGPDGSEYMRCFQTQRRSTSAASRGDFVQAAGICDKWSTKDTGVKSALRTDEVW